MKLPVIKPISSLPVGLKRLYISAYGFEDRTLGWLNSEKNNFGIVTRAFMIKYVQPKGNNKIAEVKRALKAKGIKIVSEFDFDIADIYEIEQRIEKKIDDLNNYDEIILDTSSLYKYLILIFLCILTKYKGTIRIVYSEATDYCPSFLEYDQWKGDNHQINHLPSSGFGIILRARCISSSRMQGQPVCLIAFTSFNGQLIRYMLSTINPFRLILINGVPPGSNNSWRERATYEIHQQLLEPYISENPIDNLGLPKIKSSTFDCWETVNLMDKIYNEHCYYSRMIVAATGSKMQTVGLFFSKIKHSDLHIEYPNPDKYVNNFTLGVKEVYEIEIPHFNEWVFNLAKS